MAATCRAVVFMGGDKAADAKEVQPLNFDPGTIALMTRDVMTIAWAAAQGGA